MFGSFNWLRQFTQSPEGKLWEGEAGTPSGGETPAAVPAAATPSAAVTPAASGQVPAASAAAQPEDRSGWVPPYRLREAREAAAREATQRYEAQMGQVKAELDRYRSQIQALVGATPPANTEAEAIRNQFFSLFPWAKKMEDRFGDVEQLMERANDMENQNTHYWTSYGRQNMDKLFSLASESLGAPLTDEGKRQLHSSFVGFVQSSPELTDRYASDPTLVEDFWKQFTQSFVDPARRASGAAVAARAAGNTNLPQDTPSGIPAVGGAPKLNGLDERAAAAWLEYQTRMKP